MKANNKFYIVIATAFLILAVYFCRNCGRSDESVREYSQSLSQQPLEAPESVRTPNADDIVIKPDHAYTNAQIANAIKYAENSKKYPYGIKSIKCSSLKMRRLACIQSIEANRKRWARAGNPGHFLDFMQKRYCPKDAHPLNKYWVRNVRKYLRR